MGYKFVINTENRGPVNGPAISKKEWTKARKRVKVRKKPRPKPTAHEDLFAVLLDSKRVRYIPQYQVQFPNGTVAWLDFYLPRLKWGVEIDGGHHFTAKGRERDKRRTKAIFGASGGRVRRIVRLSNSAVKRGEADPWVARLLGELGVPTLADCLLMDV